MNVSFYQGRRVFVTGHTGFKGAWLAQWLLRLGAEVHGYALPPPTTPSLFEQLGLKDRLHHTEGDVRDQARLQSVLKEVQPDIVFHLAAQSLVRSSYVAPVSTFATNAMGTVHLLESLRSIDRPCAAVMVTSDKCYENHEWCFGYREIDRLGGSDPYSCSKAMAELAIASYRASYFIESPIRIASGRAGNVIGGGDWAQHRIVPDCVRAIASGKEILVRNRRSRRPWQHVLEPLHGYLHLAAEIATASPERAGRLAGAFNFGPGDASNRTVEELVQELLQSMPGRWREQADPDGPREASVLHLCTDKADALLNWRSHWDFATAVRITAQWYQQVANGDSAEAITTAQIQQYESTIQESDNADPASGL